MSIQERFVKTKDGRIRFNAIFASFLLVYMTIWIIEFVYFSIFKYIFSIDILIANISSTIIILVNIVISSYFSYASYYWHYQKNLIDRDYAEENEKNNLSIKLSTYQTFSLITYIMYKLAVLFLPISLMIFLLAKKNYIEEIEFIIIFLAVTYFLFFIGKKMYLNIDRKNFINLKYHGHMTSYSEKTND